MVVGISGLPHNYLLTGKKKLWVWVGFGYGIEKMGNFGSGTQTACPFWVILGMTPMGDIPTK